MKQSDKNKIQDIALQLFVISGVFANLVIWFAGIYIIIKSVFGK